MHSLSCAPLPPSTSIKIMLELKPLACQQFCPFCPPQHSPFQHGSRCCHHPCTVASAQPVIPDALVGLQAVRMLGPTETHYVTNLTAEFTTELAKQGYRVNMETTSIYLTGAKILEFTRVSPTMYDG